VIGPVQLHRNEGARADVFAFTSSIAFVKFRMSKKWSGIVNHLHVYTAGRELELPRYTTLGDILAGTYGKMDKENPLRVTVYRIMMKQQIVEGGPKRGRGNKEYLTNDLINRHFTKILTVGMLFSTN